MGRKDIAKDGIKTRFSKTNPPRNQGRKKSLFKRLKVEYPDFGLEEYTKAVTTILQMNKKELQQQLDDDDNPLLFRAICKAVMNVGTKGRLASINEILDRKFGKATENVNSTIKGYALKGFDYLPGTEAEEKEIEAEDKELEDNG